MREEQRKEMWHIYQLLKRFGIPKASCLVENGTIYIKKSAVRDLDIEHNKLNGVSPTVWTISESNSKAYPYKIQRCGKGASKHTQRVAHSVSRISQWIEELTVDGRVDPFDDFDINPMMKQVLIHGSAIKYCTHSTPLEDMLWRPALHIYRGLLCHDEGAEGAGMTKEEVLDFLKLETIDPVTHQRIRTRKGERADWWFIYQVVVTDEEALDEAPWRTLVTRLKNRHFLLTIPSAYPPASASVRRPMSRVWDPF